MEPLRLLLLLVPLCFGADDDLEYVVLEELPVGTLIGNVVVDHHLADVYSNQTLSSMRFSILSHGDSEEALFDIDETSGVIRTTHRIDRDALCPQQPDCYLWLDVATLPVSLFRIYKIRITVLDINDKKPTFSTSSFELQISESSVPGTVFTLPAAADMDSGNNAVQDYDIVTETDIFDLQTEYNEVDGSQEVRLVLLKAVDRESRDRYSIVITARDGGQPAMSGSLTVNIIIEDDNDNAPVFGNTTYEATVREDVPPGVVVTNVQATDADLGANGQVRYSLSRSSSAFDYLFSVDQATGDIILKSFLDYEERNVYVLTIEAKDSGSTEKTSKCRVVVKVEDVNDNAPRISISTLSSPTANVGEVMENSPMGTFVAHLNVDDRDSGINGQVQCVVSHPAFQLQAMYTGEFILVTSEVFDREAKASYVVAVGCLDQGYPSNIASANLTVRVLDVNDNVPVFEKSLYTASIRENNAMDEVLLDVKATDADAGENGYIRYRLADALSLFNIHPKSGQISTNAVLDHETVEKLTFHVLAVDGGQPSMTSTATVVLSITDMNDNSPTFPRDTYAFATYENQPVGTEIGSVLAEDVDEDPQLTYSITDCDDSETEKSFVIDAKSGRISIKRILDREVRQMYKFAVTVLSEAFPPMSASVNVIVHIADVNDNVPVITFPTISNNTISVSPNTITGTMITKIEAQDDDIGANARLWYYILDDPDELFWIDPTSGSLAVNKPLTGHAGSAIKLNVLVEDSGEPKMSTRCLIVVQIQGSQQEQLTSGPQKMDRGETMTIALSLVSVFIISVLVASILLMWRKGVFTRPPRKPTDSSQNPPKPNESQRMLNSFTMISFVRENESNDDKDNNLNNDRHRK